MEEKFCLQEGQKEEKYCQLRPQFCGLSSFTDILLVPDIRWFYYKDMTV
jgi:hypothetical protein